MIPSLIKSTRPAWLAALVLWVTMNTVCPRFAFATVGKEFKLIEQNTKTILIPAQERAKEIAEELKLKGANKKLIREAGKYCVNVYENLFRKMYDAGMFVGVSEELKEDFFVLKDCSNYSDETGLQVKAELGMDIWL